MSAAAMNPDHLSPKTLIAEVLAFFPQAATVLIELRLNCPGCSMVRFCTIEDLCGYYDLGMNQLITTLKERMVKNASY